MSETYIYYTLSKKFARCLTYSFNRPLCPITCIRTTKFFLQNIQLDPNILCPRPQTIILGDLNYNIYTQNPRGVPSSWKNVINSNFFDSLSADTHTIIPTFTNKKSRTSIDWILTDCQLQNFTSNPQHKYLPPSWTDHSYVSVDIQTTPNQIHGHNMWRLNTSILNEENFISLLEETLENAPYHLDSIESPKEKWDCLKNVLKQLSISYCQKRSKHKQITSTKQNKQRTDILRQLITQPSSTILHQQLHSIENAILTDIIQRIDIAAIKSDNRWREKGERVKKYFFGCLKQRQKNSVITALKHPETGELVSTVPGMLRAANIFYTNLYTPTEITPASVQILLQQLPEDMCLNSDESSDLVKVITIDELRKTLKNHPKTNLLGRMDSHTNFSQSF